MIYRLKPSLDFFKDFVDIIIFGQNIQYGLIETIKQKTCIDFVSLFVKFIGILYLLDFSSCLIYIITKIAWLNIIL